MQDHPFDAVRLGTCTVPTGTRGPWKISTFEVSREDAEAFNFSLLRGMFGSAFRYRLLRVDPGRYHRLTHEKRGVIMSNTPMEISTNRVAFEKAHGRVLINGLGMGMLLEAILGKRNALGGPLVSHVRVVELDQDVIDLVGPHFARDPRVEIVQANALEYKPGRGEFFDYVWHDIWDEISEANLKDMAELGRRYNRKVAGAQDHWGRPEIRAMQRRWR